MVLANLKHKVATFDQIAGQLSLDQMPLSTGTVYYVHGTDGDNTNAGTSKSAPLATWDAAVNKCSEGDVVCLMEGHTENIAAAAGVDLDVAGVRTFGEGAGDKRPVITFITSADADIDIDAAGVEINNVIFKCNIASQTAMIDVNKTGCVIRNCEFQEGTATGLSFIDVNGGSANACDDLKIIGNYFYAPTAGNMDFAIELGEVADSVLIEGNRIIGDFDSAGIHNPTGKVLTHLQINNNVVHNLQSGQHAIELVSACTGSLNDNRLYSDAYATTLDPGSLKCNGNLAVSAIDEGGITIPAGGDETTQYIGTDSADNDAATTNVAANEDGSLLERLEKVQEATNKGTGTALGANRSLVDELAGAALNYGRNGYFAVTADLESETWNTATAHEIATVTGLVRLRILVECTETGDDTSGNTATAALGDEETADALIAATEVDDLLTGELWFDATPTEKAKAFSTAMLDYISNGLDIGYTIAGEAATDGILVFHVWWEALNATGAVAAGDGSAL